MLDDPANSSSGELVERRATGPRPGSSACRLVRWEPAVNNSSALLGWVTVAFPGGWTVHAIPVFRTRDGGLSAGAPSSPILAADGAQLRGEDGRKRYAQIITFETAEAKAGWSATICAALAEGGIR
jgi:hypothetical protein